MLSRLVLSLGRRLRAEHLWTASVVGFLLMLEVAGRRLPSELWDAALLALVTGLLGVLLRVDAATPRRWRHAFVHGVVRRWNEEVERLSVTAGIDMRATPPIPQRSIPVMRLALVALSSATALAVLFLVWSPAQLRASALQASYVVYLSLLGLLWAALVVGIAISAFLLFANVHDAFVRRHHRRRRARKQRKARSLLPEVVAHACVAALVAASALAFPPWIPMAVGVLAWSVPVLLLWRPGSPTLGFLWRGNDGIVHGVSWQRISTGSLSIGLLALLLLTFVAVGPPALGLSVDGLAGREISSLLGHVLAWSGGAALSWSMLQFARTIWRSERTDPRRPSPTEVQLEDTVQGAPAARALLEKAGFRVRVSPQTARPGAVGLILAETMPPLPQQAPRWPLKVSLRTLATPEVCALVSRRDEIQRRRRLMAGFELLFKAAARRKFESGTGFWLAPHLWFMSGMARDEIEQESFEDDAILDEVVGPPYAEVFERESLHTLHEIMATLELDLFFVEDGLGFGRFRRVLRVLFEHHDVQRRRIDERHLGGLPGVRAVIHEFVIGEPHGRNGYPEPDYDEIGRARILHLFKDRGEDDDPFASPAAAPGERRPAPALV